MSIGSLMVRPLTVLALRTMGFRPLLFANGVFTAAVIASFSLVEPTTPHWLVFLLALTFGIARSTQFMTTNTLTYADVPPAALSRATSLGGVVQQLTVSFGVSIAAALLAAIAGPDLLPSVHDFHVVFLLVACITLASVPGFLLLQRNDGADARGQKRRAGPLVPARP
jgi:hypothetical protein